MGFQTLVSGSSVPLYTFVFPQHCSQWNRPRHSTKHPKPIVPPANRPQNRRRPTLTFTLLSCCSVYKAQTSTSRQAGFQREGIPNDPNSPMGGSRDFRMDVRAFHCCLLAIPPKKDRVAPPFPTPFSSHHFIP